MKLDEALALADHASPMPHLAGQALKVLRDELVGRPVAAEPPTAKAPRPSMQFTLGQAETLLAFFGGSNGDMTVEYFPANYWPDIPEAPAGLYVYCTEYPDEGAQWLGAEDNSEDIKPAWSPDTTDEPAQGGAELLNEAHKIIWESRSFASGGPRVSVSRAKWYRLGEIVQELSAQPRAVPNVIPLTDTLRSILGKMCFTLIHIANALRAAGYQIDHRAEDEQAVCLHWMLNLYLKHGDEWGKAATQFLEEAKAKLTAAQGAARG